MITTTSSSESRERMLIFGTWLVGLGSAFLVKQVMGWEWTQAWPLFVILLGAAGSVTAVLTRHHTRMGLWGIWWPLAVLVVGIVLLLSTTGSLGIAPGELFSWWPVVAIGLGIWFLIGAVLVRERELQTEVAVPLAGLTEAEVKLNFGGGELTIGQAQPGQLISGRFEGGVIQHSKGVGRFELSPFDPRAVFFSGRALHWDVGITPDIPVDLRLDSGANRSTIDLTTLRIRRLELHTGASETHIRLPAAGATSVRVEAGVASVTMEVPQGVAARIRGKVTLGATKVDETRFPRSLEGWSSVDYETATNRVDIEVEGGLGSVRIA